MVRVRGQEALCYAAPLGIVRARRVLEGANSSDNSGYSGCPMSEHTVTLANGVKVHNGLLDLSSPKAVLRAAFPAS